MATRKQVERRQPRQPQQPLRGTVAEFLRSLQNPYILLWTIFLVASPFYLFPSGSPQPADFILVALLLTILPTAAVQVPVRAAPAAKALFLFLCYAFAISATWAGLSDNWTLGTSGHLIHPIFYLYNTLVFLLALVLHTRFPRSFLIVTIYAVALAVASQVLSVLFQPSSATRDTGWLNSPNQLGYFALLSATIVSFASKRVKTTRYLLFFVYAGAVYLAIASMSKAAMFAVLLLALLTFISRPGVLVLSFAALAALFTFYQPAATTLKQAHSRVQVQQSEEHGELAYRGYDRIWRNPAYVLVGAAEGGQERFARPSLGTMEIHSSPGTLIFSYGIIGSTLFALFVARLFRGHVLLSICQAGTVGLYGLTHQGLRFSLLWVLFAVVSATAAPARAAGSVDQP